MQLEKVGEETNKRVLVTTIFSLSSFRSLLLDLGVSNSNLDEDVSSLLELKALSTGLVAILEPLGIPSSSFLAFFIRVNEHVCVREGVEGE